MIKENILNSIPPSLIFLIILFVFENIYKRYRINITTKKLLSRYSKNITFYMTNKLVHLLILLPINIYITKINIWDKPILPNNLLGVFYSILILDSFNYLFHRLSHKIPVLWKIHEVHHLDNIFDVTTGLRVHCIEILAQILFRGIPIIILSIPLKTVVFFELILVFCALFHHSNLRIQPWIEDILSYFFITPKIHCVHHHATIPDTDSNFGFIFIFWDKLFNTFNPARRKVSWKIGLEYTDDLYLKDLLLNPFKKKSLKQK